MKFLLATFIALIANNSSYAFKVPAVGSGALAKDLQDFVDLIPFPDLVNLTKTYTAQDKEFKTAMNLMKSVELKEWLQFVESNPEFTVLMNFMWRNGLNSYNLVNQLNEKVGIPRIPFIFRKFFPNIFNLKITGGINGFIKDAKSIVPIESLKKLYNDKLKTSQVWKSVVDEVTSDKYHGYYYYIFNNLYYRNLEQNATNAGLNKDSFRTYLPILIVASII
ncbi:uncharacterized protein LOC122716837 [Apis laboriosa]|uniref:uncharacterized protein LOC122716837 n=1 Tax=Apis laboriosa TaxID=183418 RepID=UPI001CC46F54|nr:uncharacterized protein LOC122716837 [Apis laboriosa]